MSGSNQPAGWYPAEGDPAGTVRWWDGGQWVGGPQAQDVQQQAGYVVPGASTIANGRELADPWMRIAAAVIDGVLIGIIGAIFGGGAVLSGAVSGGGDSLDLTSGSFVLLGLIGSIVIATYHTLMNTFMSGGLGKQLLGLRIVRADGTEPLGTPDGVKRSANHILDILSVIPILGVLISFFVQGLINLVSLVFLFSDSEHRTVMDRFADTYVVTKQK